MAPIIAKIQRYANKQVSQELPTYTSVTAKTFISNQWLIG